MKTLTELRQLTGVAEHNIELILAESDFGSGIKSMAQNTLPVCYLLRTGAWDIDRMERWLKAVIENSRIGDLEESK